MIVWVASYPKSGNTFLRILLSDYMYGDLDKEYNFSNLSKIEMFPNLFRYYPLIDEKIIDNLSELQNEENILKYSIYLQKKFFSKGIHFVKTHSANFNFNNIKFTSNEITACAIYIVRDPRNILTSYSEYLNQSKDYVLNLMTQEITIRQRYKQMMLPTTYVGSWKTNYLSWKEKQAFVPIKIIKYENLISNTEEVFLDILLFLNKFANIETNTLKMNLVIKRTEFTKLQELEKKGLFNEMNDFDKSNYFFKSGVKRNWKNSLEDNYVNNLNNFFGNEINNLGY